MVRLITKISISLILLTGVFLAPVLLEKKAEAAILYEAPCLSSKGHAPLTAPWKGSDGKTYGCARKVEGDDTFPANADGSCFLPSPSFDFLGSKLCIKGDHITLGQSKGNPGITKQCDPFTSACNESDNLWADINAIANFLSIGVGVIVTIMVVVGGIQYSAAGGDPQKVAQAKSRILNAIFALVAYGLLYMILQFLIPGGIGF